MVSAKKKGDKHELECAKLFEKDGYIVAKSPRTMKMIWTPKGKMYISQSNDYFNLYDLICLAKGLHVWVQVKTNVSDVYGAKKKIELFHDKYMNGNDSSQVWLRVSRKGWVSFVYSDYGWFKEYYDLKGEDVAPFVYS